MRAGFDKDEPNWLPANVLDILGRAQPIVVEDLGAEEIDELKAAAPALCALLADEHPARDIARNLFRLSRLLEVQGSAHELRSEVDLLERWWSTADGVSEGRRDRARLLCDLSDAVLAGHDHIETRASPIAIETLIASESLRELSVDRIAFRHDVLREWGVAARLHDDPALLDRLPLARPAPPSLARGVELGARFALERDTDELRWVAFLERVSPVGAHASWRRFALLAILRSELAFKLLQRAAPSLFDSDGALLRELIRTAIAVESKPLAETLAKLGFNISAVPAGIYGPGNGSWAILVQWLLARRADLPLQALPEVVELFQSLSASMFFADPLTPTIAIALADWLEEIEDATDHHPLGREWPRFATAYDNHDLYRLAKDIRSAFALMAARVPERAERYLRSVMTRRNPAQTIRDIMRFRGSFAQAASTALVELTLAGLITTPVADGRPGRRSMRPEILSHLDTDFLPSSPTQGPFLDLLKAAPGDGLMLIRGLVNHAVAVLSKGREPGEDGLTLMLLNGPRFFSWERTYYWSRDAHNCYAIECALMALEAWSHARIERGDEPQHVIDDILGPDDSPSAFVLVAVDVLISHWPKTLAVIVPFLASPELLSLDRSRQTRDMMPEIDLLGWGAVGSKEPPGEINLASLKKRVSRRARLEDLLGHFIHTEGAECDELRSRLAAAAARLGPPVAGDTFTEPRLMASYAINLTDPRNWRPQDGGLAYFSPPDEARHLADLHALSASQTEDLNINTAIQTVLEKPERSSTELAERAVAYAKRLQSEDAPEDALGSLTNATVSAAMMVARDGSDQLLEEHEGWVRSVFTHVFAETEVKDARSMRDGIRHNPIAIATLGVIHLRRRRRLDADLDQLLVLAALASTEAAQGFGAGVESLRKSDPKLIPAILRCAFSAQIHPTVRWDEEEEKKMASQARYDCRIRAAIDAERAWLRGDHQEPCWPLFPEPPLHVRRGLRIGDDHEMELSQKIVRTDEEVYTQSAALWLRQLTCDSDHQFPDWVPDFVNAYAAWTARANGAGYECSVEFDNRLNEWNDIFFRLLARTLCGRNPDQASLEVARAIAVPDKSFFDIAETLVRELDELHFNDLGLDLEMALRLRGTVADRLVESAGWRRERNRSEMSVEMWVGPAIGVLFFNTHSSLSGSRCYLLAKGIDRVEAYFPLLTRLIKEGPVPFTALLTMNVLEVSPKPEHAAFFLASAMTWLRRQPDNALLWTDSGLGARISRWLDAIISQDASLRLINHPLRSQLDDLLARLVQVGVPEAHRIERSLAHQVK